VCPNLSQKKAVLQNYLTQHNIPIFFYWYQKSIIWKYKDLTLHDFT
jgi:hypothetical protein